MIAISFVSAIFMSRYEFSITFAANLNGFGFVGTRSNYLFVGRSITSQIKTVEPEVTLTTSASL